MVRLFLFRHSNYHVCVCCLAAVRALDTVDAPVFGRLRDAIISAWPTSKHTTRGCAYLGRPLRSNCVHSNIPTYLLSLSLTPSTVLGCVTDAQ